MRRRCRWVRWRRVDNASLIHRNQATANTTFKDEPLCLDTAAPRCRAQRISSQSTYVIAVATSSSAMSSCYARRFAPPRTAIPFKLDAWVVLPDHRHASGRYRMTTLISCCAKGSLSEVAWKWRVEKASPFSTLRNVDVSAEWVGEMA